MNVCKRFLVIYVCQLLRTPPMVTRLTHKHDPRFSLAGRLRIKYWEITFRCLCCLLFPASLWFSVQLLLQIYAQISKTTLQLS
ncbi:hypothetical protein VIGAN_05156600 [Vigna angularis var. angularis]|uniref:Uncharacterized protein n=1 Tax=Vigna angularis var. angularis TaxID=157739 RepID=A0A0S3S5K6_PHAAN|nr:hypothetical protein VIGAN_05156600 [Vigna angularis var. angularis]